MNQQEPNASAELENPLDGDFFMAMNAYRAARNSDDPEAMRAAEDALRAVVRSELTGGCNECG